MKINLIWFMLLLPYLGFSQEEAVVEINKSKKQDVYVIVDTPPRFKGGEKKLNKFYSKQSKFKITDNRKDGLTVYFQFIVDTTGEISELQILRSPTQELSNEIERLVSLMPDWIPGIKNSEKVRVKITQELSFSK